MKRLVPVRRGIAALLVIAAALLGVVTSSTTQAAFTDDEYTSASIGTAASLPPPTALTCAVTGGTLLDPVLTFGWTGLPQSGTTYRYSIAATLGNQVAETAVAASPAPPYRPGAVGLTVTFSVKAVLGTYTSAAATKSVTLSTTGALTGCP